MATRFTHLLGKLFAVGTRSAGWLADRRKPRRSCYSVRRLAIVEQILIEHLTSVVPGGRLGKALRYLHGQWQKLIPYMESGDWSIGNACENSINSFVVPRKNFVSADTVAGTHASVNLNSLVELAKASGIDPQRYLVWLFRRIPLTQTVDDYAALRPWNMPVELR